MTTPIHVPNITVKFYPDSDHYIVSGWLRICNILLSYLVDSLAVFMDSTEREASGSKRRSGREGRFIGYYQRGTRGIRLFAWRIHFNTARRSHADHKGSFLINRWNGPTADYTPPNAASHRCEGNQFINSDGRLEELVRSLSRQGAGRTRG
jgi:hypothetical protein